MRYGSVCSGIDAASVAWEPLGWKPAWFCEVAPFASAVLAHRFPGVPNYGDFTNLALPTHPVRTSPDLTIDLLVGGTPCQDFSNAGLRAGITGDRGSLTLEFCRLVGALQPKWLVWENVPGVLSSDGGRAFGAFIGALAELRYGFAWRMLDAQYFGLAQRRKRVFVVGCAGGDSSRAAEVLFERKGMRRDSPSRRRSRGQEPSTDALECAVEPTEPVGFNGYQQSVTKTANTIMSPSYKKVEVGVLVSRQVITFEPRYYTRDNKTGGAPGALVSLNASAWKAGDAAPHVAMMEPHPPDRAFAFQTRIARNGREQPEYISPTLSGADAEATSDMRPCVVQPCPPTMAFKVGQSASAGGTFVTEEFSPTLQSHNSSTSIPAIVTGDPAHSGNGTIIRRITPREAERLQGFPDNFTLIPYRGKPATDTNRYQVIGNSMAVPVMRWIGERIQRIG